MKKVKFNFKQLFYNEKSLRVISVLLAIVLWLVVVYALSPEMAQPIQGIPITFNADTLEKLGLSVIEGGDQTVNINVYGKRLTVGELTKDDFVADVSLAEVREPGTYELEVNVTKKYANTDYKIVASGEPQVIKVKFDRYITKKIPLYANMTGVKAAEGFIMDKYYTNPSHVTISGPEYEVSKVAKCVVDAEYPDQINKTYMATGEIKLYDVMDRELELQNIVLDKEVADVTIPVLETKLLPVSFKFINIPDGFDQSSLDYAVSTTDILVAGPPEEIEKMSSIDIGYIDIKTLTPDGMYMFNVDLPDGFVNLDDISNVKIDFQFDNYVEQRFNIKNLTLLNVPENYDVTLETKRINNVTIVGPADVVESVSSGDIAAEIDLSDRDLSTSSRHSVPVKIVIPSKNTVWAIGDYTVVVTVKEK